MKNLFNAENIDKIDSVRMELLDCKTEADVDKVFSKVEGINFAARTAFLHSAMQMEVFSIDDDDSPASDEEVYNYYLKMFLDGEWKDYV